MADAVAQLQRLTVAEADALAERLDRIEAKVDDVLVVASSLSEVGTQLAPMLAQLGDHPLLRALVKRGG